MSTAALTTAFCPAQKY